VNGFAPDPTATLRSFGIPQDEAARTNAPPQAQDIATNTLTGADTTFTYNFPPLSMTLFTLAPAAPLLVVLSHRLHPVEKSRSNSMASQTFATCCKNPAIYLRGLISQPTRSAGPHSPSPFRPSDTPFQFYAPSGNRERLRRVAQISNLLYRRASSLRDLRIIQRAGRFAGCRLEIGEQQIGNLRYSSWR